MTDSRYRLIKYLGQGASGKVYLAESEGAEAALRQFAPSSQVYSGNVDLARRRFLEAGRQAALLRHPNIVPVLEVVEEDGEAFIAMEYMQQGTLGSALVAREVAVRETNGMLRQIALALDFAHERGVVHGDVKPSKIFAADGAYKISGFAISPRFGPASAGSIGHNLVHGFLSPEHINVPGGVGPKSDQYGLAAVAYRAYTGREPVLGGALPAPSSIRPQLPKTVDAVFAKALRANPSERYPSCIEFAAVLESVMILEDPRPSRKPKLFLLAAAAMLMVAMAVLAASLAGSKKAPSKNLLAQTRQAAHGPNPVKSIDVQPEAPPRPKAVDTEANAKNMVRVPKEDTPPAVERPKQVAKMRPEPSETAVLPERGARPVPLKSAALDPAGTQSLKGKKNIDRRLSSVSSHDITIQLLSRDHRINNGEVLNYLDPTRGELGHGDLKLVVDSPDYTKGWLSVDWLLDNVPVESRMIDPGKFVEYGNEPMPGLYQVVVKLNGKPMQSFTFRMSR